MALFKPSRYAIVVYLISIYGAVLDLSSFCKAAEFSFSLNDSLIGTASQLREEVLDFTEMPTYEYESGENVPIIYNATGPTKKSGKIKQNALLIGGVALACLIIGSIIYMIKKKGPVLKPDFAPLLQELVDANGELKAATIQWIRTESPRYDMVYFESVWQAQNKKLKEGTIDAFMAEAVPPLNDLDLTQFQPDDYIKKYIQASDIYIYKESIKTFNMYKDLVLSKLPNMADLQAFDIKQDMPLIYDDSNLSRYIGLANGNFNNPELGGKLQFFKDNGHSFVHKLSRVRMAAKRLQGYIEQGSTKVQVPNNGFESP